MSAGAPHLSIADRTAQGHAARQAVPRADHAAWSSPPGRRDPVALLEEQNRARLQWLVPIRHGRMMVSPFAFYRGAARIMAADLAAATPSSGLTVQACGDAHLANFGVYASPERQLVFDINDFDETLPGPWEWDVKRLATSFMIACRQRHLDRATCESVTARAVAGYRTGMAEAAGMRTLEVWYDHLTSDQLRQAAEWSQRAARRQVERIEQRARASDNLQALRALAVEDAGRFRIRSDPPVLLPLGEIHEFGEPPPARLPATRTSAGGPWLAATRAPATRWRSAHTWGGPTPSIVPSPRSPLRTRDRTTPTTQRSSPPSSRDGSPRRLVADHRLRR